MSQLKVRGRANRRKPKKSYSSKSIGKGLRNDCCLLIYFFNYDILFLLFLHREKKRERDREELWKKLHELELNHIKNIQPTNNLATHNINILSGEPCENTSFTASSSTGNTQNQQQQQQLHQQMQQLYINPNMSQPNNSTVNTVTAVTNNSPLISSGAGGDSKYTSPSTQIASATNVNTAANAANPFAKVKTEKSEN